MISMRQALMDIDDFIEGLIVNLPPDDRIEALDELQNRAANALDEQRAALEGDSSDD